MINYSHSAANMVMSLSRNFAEFFSSLDYFRDSLLYLCTPANLATFHAAIKGANNGFLYDHTVFCLKKKFKYEQALLSLQCSTCSPLCTQKERKHLPLALCLCQRSNEVICHPVVSTGVGCSDKLAWIKCQPWSRFTLTGATVNLFI